MAGRPTAARGSNRAAPRRPPSGGGPGRRPSPEPQLRATAAAPRAQAPTPAPGAPASGGRALVLLALPVVVVLAGIVVALAVLPAAGAAIALVGLAVLVANYVIGSPVRLIARLATYPVEEGSEDRLVNLVAGLCAAGGLPVPELRLIDDPAPNAIVLGRDAESAVLVCTTGLLDLLDRMELEAVVAHELAHVKRGDLAVAARATAALGLAAVLIPGSGELVLRTAGREREALADLAGVRLTRYPPGLVAALEKVEAAPTVRPSGIGPSVARLTACMWFASLVEAIPPEETPGVLDLQLRAAALREL